MSKKPHLFRFAVEVWKGGKHRYDIEIEGAKDWREAQATARELEPRATLGVVRNLGPIE